MREVFEIGDRALQIGHEEAYKLTLWATGVNTPDYEVPDSSLRHLLAIDRRTDLCAIESHFLTVMGVSCPVIGLSHERSSSHKFYDWVRARMAANPM
jgi:vacuolar-type H+-ATPase subunit D/Vma8